MKVLVADDHELMRECLKSLLKDEKDVEIVGEAKSGREVLEMFPKVNPDVIILDIDMPEMNGFEAMTALKNDYNFTKVIALTMLSNSKSVKNMMAAGASGYVPKSAGKEELLLALRMAVSGSKFISSDISLGLLDSIENEEAVKADKSGKGISKRELEVLKLIVKGYTNAEIAEKLFNSKRTIESHRRNMIDKTGTRNSAELVKYAISKGLVS